MDTLGVIIVSVGGFLLYSAVKSATPHPVEDFKAVLGANSPTPAPANVAATVPGNHAATAGSADAAAAGAYGEG